MAEDLRRHVVLIAAVAAAAAVGVWQLLAARSGAAAPAPPAIALDETAGAGPRKRAAAGDGLVVHVAGAVRRPGVYRVPAGARVAAALRRAGGGTARADLSGVNLAARASDGQQVLVPERMPAGPSARAGPGGEPAAPVSLSSATIEQLDALDGVGPKLAAAIVEYREQHGGFRSVDELDQVDGIGEGRLAALRDKVQP